MKMKICTVCKSKKILTDFYKHKRAKDGYLNECKECSDKRKNEYFYKFPWIRTFRAIKNRCNNSNAPRYQDYGGRGIKCLITEEELKTLWVQDRAYLLKKPSINRKNNNGNYSFENCEYIEWGLNSAERNTRILSKPILQFDKQGNFIKEWRSIKEAYIFYSKNKSTFSDVLHGRRKTLVGFIWKFK